MKKVVSVVLASLLLVGCSSTKQNVKVKDGTYEAKAKGMHGEVVAKVIVANQKIKEVIFEGDETYGVGQGMPTSPMDSYPEKIVGHQALGIDSVTGATISSVACLNAVSNACKEAGFDVEELKNKKVSNEEEKENYDVDVVVVGAGAAGMSAAITAKENGVSVLVLEKQGIAGGATTLSGGKLIAAGTKYQEAQGYHNDTSDDLLEYMKSVGKDMIDDQKVKFFCDHALEDVNWLEGLGVEIINVEPIHSAITPWRVMNTKGGGGQTSGHGGQITVPLFNKMMKDKIDFVPNAHVLEITTDKDGNVNGVKGIYKDEKPFTVSAKEVILATGGYAQNREMTAYLNVPKYVTGVPAGNIGEGITMAEKLGAQFDQAKGIQEVYVSFTSGVGINEESGLIVNDQGKRVVDEYTYQSHVATALHKTNAQVAYYIASADDPNQTVQYAISNADTPHADSAKELAKLINIDENILEETINRYNQLCEEGNDEDFHKPSEYMQKLNGTLYAIQLNPVFTVTFGGLNTDLDGCVLKEDGTKIPHLYAAGETALSGIFGDEYPSCGVAIGSSVRFGKMAGEIAAKNALGK